MVVIHYKKSQSAPKIHRYATIDVGSNAIRLLLARVWEENGEPKVKKDTFFRMPLRLGEEAFTNHKLSKETKSKLLNTMVGFGCLIRAYCPEGMLAYATSAMRELKNGQKIAKEIKKKSGIDLKIISGEKEANIIYSNHVEKMITDANHFLYVDVGGGSTELTLYSKGVSTSSRSFKIGTVRILKGLVEEQVWKEMKEWIQQSTEELVDIEGIGSGGNIGKIHKLLFTGGLDKTVSYKKIKKLEEKLTNLTYKERIFQMDLKPDRADVIVPACTIYRQVMKWARIDKMFVPSMGLVDGMVVSLYERYLKKDEG